jgi:hypothetical protein
MNDDKGLMKQYKVKGIGGFINVVYTTAPLLGLTMYVINASTFYTVDTKQIHHLVSWVNLPEFLVALFSLFMLMIYLFYKIIYPSYYVKVNNG